MKSKPLLILSGLLILLLGFALNQAKYLSSTTSPPKTFILNKDFSNKNISVINELLPSQFPLPQELSIRARGRYFTIKTTDIDLSINTSETTAQIINSSQNKKGLSNLLQFIPISSTNKNYPLKVSYDAQKLQAKLGEIATLTDQAFIPSRLELKSGKLSYLQGQIGHVASTKKLESDLSSAFSNYSFPKDFTLFYEQTGQIPDSSQVSLILQKGTGLIGKSINLVLDDKVDIVADSTIISWLDFSNTFDIEKINQYVGILSQKFKREPTNASMKLDGRTVLEFIPARDGLELDIPQATAFLKQQVEKIEASSDKNITIDIPSKKTQPQIPNQAVNNLGINELLGRGKSTFRHSSTIRNHNIATGARKVNRILVAPGEEFSFTRNLGSVDASTGFKEAYVIKGSGTELEYGGGVCQVSTTMFRAMLNSGLNITARKNHSYRVSYYEEDMPPGYDATVYSPNPDLKFINDTPAHVLVINYYDEANKTLTYELWGTSDGRKTEITGYRQWGAASAPPARYIDDPALPAGKLVRTETPVAGLKTSFDWKVVRSGQELHRKTFVSTFVPWAAVYRRGTAI